MSKPFKQTCHITDIKHNIFGIQFITKYIPTIKILNSRIHMKNKHKNEKHSLNIFSKNKPTTTIFLQTLLYIQSGTECNCPFERIRAILAKIKGKFFTTVDMNSAYNQKPLDEQSRRFTQLVIGGQQYELKRLFY